MSAATLPSVFHKGELQVQARAGTRGAASELAMYLASALGPGVASLLESLRVVWLSSLDFPLDGGAPRVWVSPAFGPPRFVRALGHSELTLPLRGSVPETDILWRNLRRPAPHSTRVPLGLLALDLERRRRYRVNGSVDTTAAGGEDVLRVAVEEAFPNCPKYIQARAVDPNTDHLPALAVPRSSETPRALVSCSLSEDDTALIRAADTFFLGTYFSTTGMDASHRGGRPGFVRVTSPNELFWPEYRGNGMFQSLGNLEVNDAAGLAFLDFNTGSVLQLTGRARVEWGPMKDPSVEEAAERIVVFRIDGVRRSQGPATNYRWHLLERSLYNPMLPCEVNGAAAPGNRKQVFPMEVELVNVWDETRNVKTFRFLAPKRVHFLPGQYGTFEFPGELLASSGPVVRTWTLSEASTSTDGDVTLEVSVKRKEAGIVSSWLHSSDLQGGLKVRLLGIGGEMTPFKEDVLPRKFLFVSGGIGITPNMAILRGFGRRVHPGVHMDVVFLHQERHVKDVPFSQELRRRARTSSGTLRVLVLESRARETPETEHTGDEIQVIRGRVGEQRLKDIVPDVLERVVYLCGPEGFMSEARRSLSDTGYNISDVVTESFNF